MRSFILRDQLEQSTSYGESSRLLHIAQALAVFLILITTPSLSYGGLITVAVNSSVGVSLVAGSYSAQSISGAWNAWGGKTGFDPDLNETVGWLNGFSVNSPSVN